MIRQERERSLLSLVPNFNDPEKVLAIGGGLAVKVNDLVLADTRSSWNRPILDHLEGSVVFQPGDEVNTLMTQPDEPFVIDVAPVHDHDCPRFKPESARHLYVACLAVCDHSERRQITVVVQ